MQDKTHKGTPANFAFRIKIGEFEIEMNGSRDQVIETIKELPNLITNVQRAFETVKPKTVATLTVKAETGKDEPHAQAQKYPKIASTENCDEAILKVLETDWGKWRPRTFDELKDALNANGLDYSGKTLSTVLMTLVKKGLIRRWNTNAGYVFILAEKEAVSIGGEAK